MASIKNNDDKLYVTYYVPIMVQSRWHKKKRINKKWLKRYGMKEDNILVIGNCDSMVVNYDTSSYPDCLGITNNYYVPKYKEYEMTFNSLKYKLRPDQMRRNLKMENDYYEIRNKSKTIF